MTVKPDEQFTEAIHGKTTQLTTIKPVPWVGNYHFRLRRVHSPPAKGYTRGGIGLPSQEL